MECGTDVADGLCSPVLKKKKKKKKKRRHSEVEAPASTLPAKPRRNETEIISEKRKEKKRKKRKREAEQYGLEAQREAVQSHMEPPPQEEDWCLGDTWTISEDATGTTETPNKQNQHSEASTEPKLKLSPPKTQPSPSPSLLPLPSPGPEPQACTLKKKKKKKKKRLGEELQESEGKPDVYKSANGTNGTTQVNAEREELRELKKKAKKRKREEARLREAGGTRQELPGYEPIDQMDHVETETCKPAGEPAAMVVWDSQVRDSFKRSRDTAASEDAPEKGTRPAPVAWDGKKSSSVVEELLKNARDKAYGTEVLSWDGEKSAISKDAIDDARWAKTDTVIDEWDEEFDSGKVKKIKFKKERRRSGNVFQKIQDHRNMWSVTAKGRRNSLGYHY